MSNERLSDMSCKPHDPAPLGQPGRPVDQLFPVMAVLLAQVLDLDQTTKESSR